MMDQYGWRPSSAFHPDEPETSLSVSILTASVLGILLTEQLLNLDSQPGQTLEHADAVISEAITKAIYRIDVEEINQMRKARIEALMSKPNKKGS